MSSPATQSAWGLRSVGDRLKRVISFVARLAPKARDRALPPVVAVRRVLIVRANFRMGNTVLVTAMLPALRARFPAAEFEILTADTTMALLNGLGFAEVHPISRRFIRRPWEFVVLFRTLRNRRFDVAVDGGLHSFSGALYSWLSGATWRIGARNRHDHFLNVRLRLPACRNVYTQSDAFAQALGVATPTRPRYVVSPSEADGATQLVESLACAQSDPDTPIIALFVGGHRHKKWPQERWRELIRAIDASGSQAWVFGGPEETNFLQELSLGSWRTVTVMPLLPIRAFAAVLAKADRLLTPDSGPMHLAAALGVPVLALLQSPSSGRYVPPYPENLQLVAPTCEDVLATLRRMNHSPRQHPPALPEATIDAGAPTTSTPALCETAPSPLTLHALPLAIATDSVRLTPPGERPAPASDSFPPFSENLPAMVIAKAVRAS